MLPRWQTRTPPILVVVALALFSLSGCLGLEAIACSVDEVGYTHVGSFAHPNDKDTLVFGHVQNVLGEEPGIELHAGPICAYPFEERWRTARFDEDGRYDEREGLVLPAVGAYQVWGTMVKNGEVLAEGDPVEDALIVQVYVQNLYPFPDLNDPIIVEIPIACCHGYDTRSSSTT